MIYMYLKIVENVSVSVETALLYIVIIIARYYKYLCLVVSMTLTRFNNKHEPTDLIVVASDT